MNNFRWRKHLLRKMFTPKKDDVSEQFRYVMNFVIYTGHLVLLGQ
jgi:hypothetical protein